MFSFSPASIFELLVKIPFIRFASSENGENLLAIASKKASILLLFKLKAPFLIANNSSLVKTEFTAVVCSTVKACPEASALRSVWVKILFESAVFALVCNAAISMPSASKLFLIS